ncbi:hypothetical protein EPN44_04825 [bacterium]|nr:MAG: hypothetical protein EPN44_04825 [bacterium]
MKHAFVPGPRGAALSIGLALVALLWLQERILAGQVSANAHLLAYEGRLPVKVMPEAALSHAAAWKLVIIALLMGGGLYVLYRSLAPAKIGAAALVGLGLAFVAMVTVDLRVAAVMSTDAYAYIGYGVLPSLHDAYAPPNSALPGEFSLVNQIWGLPLVPCIYGPLWLEGIRVTLSGAHTLSQAWLAVRLFNVVMLVALALLVYAVTRSLPGTAIIALNPAIHQLFIADAHNDLAGIVLLIGGLLAYRRGWSLIAVALIVCAGLVKLPFVVVGLLFVVYEPALTRRLAAGASMLGLTVAAYAIWVGPSYFPTLLHVATADSLHGAAEMTGAFKGFVAIHFVLLGIAAIAVALAVLRDYLWEGARWSYIAIGGALEPWYLLWVLPSLMMAPKRLVEYAVALPLLALLLGHATSLFGNHGTVTPTLACVALLAVYEGLRWPVVVRPPRFTSVTAL